MRVLPGLCGDYCSEYWHQCRYTLGLLTDSFNASALAAMEEDSALFCSFLELRDREYCYPNVLSNTQLNANLGAVREDPEGCLELCLQEVEIGRAHV